MPDLNLTIKLPDPVKSQDTVKSAAAPHPPLILLHGLYGQGRNWGGIAKALNKHFSVYAPDMRNHGSSPWAPDMRYTDMAEDIIKLIAHIDQGPVYLLGHSMGGKAAMATALTRPDLIKKLIIADTAPTQHPDGQSSFIKSMQALPLTQITRKSEADAHLAQTIHDKGIRDFLSQSLIRNPDGVGMQWKFNLDTLAEKLGDILDFPATLNNKTYNGPTLFITGGKSDYFIATQHQAQAQALFPALQIREIPQAGHWVHAEAPRDFLALTEAFLLHDKSHAYG